MRFFGGWECAASFGKQQVATPVGEKCAGTCQGIICPGDKGVILPHLGPAPEPELPVTAFGRRDWRVTASTPVTVEVTVWHRDCFLHEIGAGPFIGTRLVDG